MYHCIVSCITGWLSTLFYELMLFQFVQVADTSVFLSKRTILPWVAQVGHNCIYVKQSASLVFGVFRDLDFSTVFLYTAAATAVVDICAGKYDCPFWIDAEINTDNGFRLLIDCYYC